MCIAPAFQCPYHFLQGLSVCRQAVFHTRRHLGQYAADFVETQHFIDKQPIEYRAFPFAADHRQRSFHRAAFGAVELGMESFAHGYLLSNYMKNKSVLV